MFSKLLYHKFEILGAATVIAGITGYLFYKRSKNQYKKKYKSNKKEKLTIEPTFDTMNASKVHSYTGNRYKWSSLYSEYYFDKNLEIRKVLDYLDTYGINIETIYKYSPLIAVNYFKEFTKEIRNRRRLIRTVNEDQYVKLILDYEKYVDELLERSRSEIVFECEIDPDAFESMKLIFEATEDLSALVRNAKKELKELAFAKKRPISKSTLQKIINEEVSFIRTKIYDRLKTKLQNVNISLIKKDIDIEQYEVLKIIQALIDDIIFEKYGYEREEIEHAMNTQWSGELAKEIKELKMAKAELESDIGNINLFSQESSYEYDNYNDKPSQALTRSGGNNSFLIDYEDI